MARTSQIIVDYFRKLEMLLETFNFTRTGHEESMGKDAAGLVAKGIFDRSENDQGGPTGTWPDNHPAYTSRKVAKYNVALIGFRTGQMISLPSLLGKVDVEPDTVVIRYGTGKPPSQSISSSYISAADKAIADVKKAEYFTEKKGPFFEVDDRIAHDVREFVAAELAIFIGELNTR